MTNYEITESTLPREIQFLKQGPAYKKVGKDQLLIKDLIGNKLAWVSGLPKGLRERRF